MLRLLRFERTPSSAGYTIDAVFDDPKRDDGTVEYRVRAVPTDVLLGYRRFQKCVVSALGKVFTHTPSEGVPRRAADLNWREFVQRALDGASRDECVAAVFQNTTVTKPDTRTFNTK